VLVLHSGPIENYTSERVLFNIDLNPRGHAFAWPFVFLVSIRSDSLNAQ
jgi:hypothetical protein